MAKKTSSGRKKTSAQTKAQLRGQIGVQARIRREIAGIVLLAVGALLVVALFADAAGAVGEILIQGLRGVFGYMAFALPFFLIAFGLVLLIGVRKRAGVLSVWLVAVIFVLLSVVLAVHYVGADGAIQGGASLGGLFQDSVRGDAGGVIGMLVSSLLVHAIGRAGAYILLIALTVICAILAVGVPLSQMAASAREKNRERSAERAERASEREAALAEYYSQRATEPAEGPSVREAASRTQPERPAFAAQGGFAAGNGGRGGFHWPSFLGGTKAQEKGTDGKQNILDAVKNDSTYGELGGDGELGPGVPADGRGADPYGYPIIEGVSASGAEAGYEEQLPSDTDGDAERRPRRTRSSETDSGRRAHSSDELAGAMHYGLQQDERDYRLPPVSLLSHPKSKGHTESPAELKANAAKLEQALRDFKVEARVAKVTVGPTVTRYEVEPDIGVRIQNIRSLEPDLALKLEVKSVRVVPMPGQSVIGIEAYNANTQLVTLREIVDSEEFMEQESLITFALGKNISGKRIIADLAKMPHLLIAGTTGSGKSVCINSILLSFLFRAKPSELKLILIDPKVVELKSYGDIPHLLVPVVTDPERAATALSYAVAVMTDRYRMFSAEGVRNIDGYNEKLRRAGRGEEVLPQIVIVIDELSDLMMVASAKVQDSISRLAAMARAAGMHLIVATQQPLASILTSVIKANIPSRIAFSVSSNSASRVILDNPGAERLHGNGDMLFAPVGEREAMRIQGAFVSDQEVQKVTDFIKKQMDPNYSEEAVSGVNQTAIMTEGEEDDLFLDAVEMAAQTKQASVSMIQRRFRVGYNRAARLVDLMEERGIVAPSDGTNKPRRLIMSEAQLQGFLSSAGRAGAGAYGKGGEPGGIPQDPYDA